MKNMHHFCVKAAVAFFLILPVAACGGGGGGGGSSAGPDLQTVLRTDADAGPDYQTVLGLNADVSGVQTANSEDLDTTRRFYSGRFRSSNGGGGVGAGARAANHLSGVSEIIAAYGNDDGIAAFIAVLTADHGRVARPLNLPSLDRDQVLVESGLNLDELVDTTNTDSFAFINGRQFSIFNAEEFAVLGIWIRNIDNFALEDDYANEFALIHFGVNPGSIPVGAANAVYTSGSILGYYTQAANRYLITDAAIRLTANFASSRPDFSGNIVITGGAQLPLPLNDRTGTMTLELISGDIVDLPDAEDPSVTFSGDVNVMSANGIFDGLDNSDATGNYEGAFYGDAPELAGTLEASSTTGEANLLLGFFADDPSDIIP